MSDIISVFQTIVDWNVLLPAAHKVAGRSISASLDRKGYPCDGAAGLVACAAEFAKKGSDPIDVLRNDQQSLKHAHFGFLAWIERDLLYPITCLGITASAAPEGGAVLSGSLFTWREAVREMLRFHSDVRLKQLGCKLLIWFERADLGEVWGNYQKVADGVLFYLVPK